LATTTPSSPPPSVPAEAPIVVVDVNEGIAELKQDVASGAGVTYEKVRNVMMQNKITADQMKQIYEIASKNLKVNVNRVFSRYLATLGDEKKVEEMGEEVKTWKASGNKMNDSIFAALIGAYTKVGSFEKAIKVAEEEMPTQGFKLEENTLAALAKAYTKSGKREKVIEMYEKCKKTGTKVPPPLYEAYVAATLGYKPKKHRKKK